MTEPARRLRHRARVLLAVLGCSATTAALADGFSFGGKVFADLSSLQQNTPASSQRAWNGDLKRLYLDAGYAFNDTWSLHATTDVNWLRDQRLSDVWVRHFYAERRWAGGTTLRIGVADMPWQTLVSRWWGYRYVDPIATAMANLDSSADLGVQVATRADATLEMAAAVVTGGGYKRPHTGDRMDAEGYVAWHPVAQAVIAVGGYDGALGASDKPQQPLRHDARRVDVLAAWASPAWRVGVRYAWVSNWGNQYTLVSDRARSVSAWASWQFAPAWSVFARVDATRPKRLTDPTRRSRYANAGVEWRASKALRLALVGKHTALVRHGNRLRSGNELGVWSEWSF